MTKKEFEDCLKDADKYSLEYFIDEWYRDNPKYLEKFTDKQIGIMEDKLAKEEG